jgi:hypothetical protein
LLQAHRKRIPLLFAGKLILLLNLRRRELVEELLAELEKFVGCRVGRCIFRRGRLGGEREDDEEDQRAAGENPSADSGVGARWRAMGCAG